MRKTALIVLLILIGVFFECPAEIIDNVVIDGMTYSVNTSNHEATLERCEITGEITVPSVISYDGTDYNVVKIIKTYYRIFNNATKVVIPSSINIISSGVFSNCQILEDILFEDGENPIRINGKEDMYGTGAFYQCYNLKYIYVGRPFNSVNLFYQTHITGPIKLELSPSLTYINGFDDAPLNPEIDLSNIETIGGAAFYGTPLTELKLPKVVNIGSNAFKNCPIENIEFGPFLEEIGTNAFENAKIHDLILPSSLKKIGESAFVSNKKLSNIYIADSKEALYIGDCNMFDEAPIKKLYLGRNINSYSLNDYSGPFGRKNLVNYIYPDMEIVIGENVTRINDYMFVNRSFKGDITLPNSVESIGRLAFGITTPNTYQVKKEIECVTLPENLKECGAVPFEQRYINKIEVPKGIKYLTSDLFPLNPVNRYNINIPASVETIHAGSKFSGDTITLEDRTNPLRLYSVSFYGNHIYCGMPLKSSVSGNDFSCKTFEIGKDAINLSAIDLNMRGDSSIIISNPVNPPMINSISDTSYEKTKVVIEFNSLDSYNKSKEWAKFRDFEFFISIPFRSLSITIGDSAEINATINPLFKDNNSIEWISSDENIAYIENGIIATRSVGQCYITAIDKLGHKASCQISVLPVKVHSISINLNKWDCEEGDSIQLKTSILPDNATDKTIIWSSSDENVAIVDQSGLVSAINAGECVITATAADSSGITDSCNVYVTAKVIPIEFLTIEPKLWNAVEGDTLTFSATVMPENATDKSIIWSSNDTSVATVSEEGVVYALKPGETVITATAADGSGATASCNVYVGAKVILVKSLTIEPQLWNAVEGETLSLSTIVTPENATDKSVAWSSSDTSVATVSQDGVITALKPGETVVTAIAADGSGVQASCNVYVTAKFISAESLALNPSSWTGVEGVSFQITAIISPENASEKTIEWSSSNETIATVNNTGFVTVIRDGNCVITAKTSDGSNLSAECVITSTAGIKDVFTDDDTFDVYSIQGILVDSDCTHADLKKLNSGAYILQSGNKSRVIIIR